MSLTTLQRTAPPIDRWAARRGTASGGYDTTSPRTLARGLDDQDARYPGDAFDTTVRRGRAPFYHYESYMPAADSYVNWTAAGPVRPELHMRNVTFREFSGNDRSRFPVVNTPSTGMHTMGPAGVARTAGRYQDTPQQTGARIFRLSPARYSGQTYSQTTQIQGA